MLNERDYMQQHDRSTLGIPTTKNAGHFSRPTPTQWANVLILVLALLIIGFILSRILR